MDDLFSHNPDTFIVSLGLEDAYAELDLQEAIAFAQRREQYLNV
jgi:prefoldin subunit 5